MMSLEMKSPKLSMSQRLGKLITFNNTIKHTHTTNYYYYHI